MTITETILIVPVQNSAYRPTQYNNHILDR